jgi:hypothetical protein
MSEAAPVYTISLPEYTVDHEPDYGVVGGKLDKVIETHFHGKRIAIRGISLVDHPGRTLDDLVGIILALGTDRYDPDREGVLYPDPPFTIDLHAAPPSHYGGADIVSEGLRVMHGVLSDFYTGPPADRGGPLRLDILMIYDLDQLEEVPYEGWEQSCMYVFQHPDRRKEALLGVIKILR